MATRRTYGQACGIAHALDLVGERWAFLIVRELLLGPKRFTDLDAGLGGASPNVLSERLREMERAGIVRRRKLAPPSGARVYELTSWGLDLEPIVLALGVWGVRSPSMDHEAEVGTDSAVLALRTYFSCDPGQTWSGGFELGFGENRFAVLVIDGVIEVTRGQAAHPDATLEIDAKTLIELFGNGDRLEQAVLAGRMKLSGDALAVARLFDSVRLPEHALLEARS